MGSRRSVLRDLFCKLSRLCDLALHNGDRTYQESEIQFIVPSLQFLPVGTQFFRNSFPVRNDPGQLYFGSGQRRTERVDTPEYLAHGCIVLILNDLNREDIVANTL